MDTAPSMSAAQRFAKNLHAARMELNMSTAELAEKAGVGVRTVQRIEAGKHAPLLDTASDLARAVGVPLCELTGKETDRGGGTFGDEAPPAQGEVSTDAAPNE